MHTVGRSNEIIRAISTLRITEGRYEMIEADQSKLEGLGDSWGVQTAIDNSKNFREVVDQLGTKVSKLAMRMSYVLIVRKKCHKYTY